MSSDNLWNRTHPNTISPQSPQKATFRLALVHRTRHETVGSVSSQKVHSQFVGRFFGSPPQFFVVCVACGWKSRSQIGIVGPDQWIVPGQLRDSEVVADANDVAYRKICIQASRSIGHDDHSDTKTPHDRYGKDNRFHIVALVGMEASPEAARGYPTQVSKNDFALVPRYCTVGRKPRDFAVLDRECFSLQHLREFRKSGATNDTDRWGCHPFCPESFREKIGGNAIA
mmetsp:Transcript_21583/g.47142  ORF Transcript_21583/g.47142 Transcript_21583/m.47142 type:complete len:228 (-) Transcript_21583:171-854(-)